MLEAPAKQLINEKSTGKIVNLKKEKSRFEYEWINRGPRENLWSLSKFLKKDLP